MKSKSALKLIVDIFMTLALFFSMGYHLWGEILHEWIGAGMFFLFVAHHMLNGHWHKTLLKGRYHALRSLTLCVDLLVLVSMLIQMYSGIAMSRYVFRFLHLGSSMSLIRQLHILGAYWGFLLMSLHLGLHWKMILGFFRKAVDIQSSSNIYRTIAFILGLAVAGYGAYVFIDRDFLIYLFLKSEFVFFDYNESKTLFYIDYSALMGLCIFIAHFATKPICNLRRKEEK